jgi:hypothetical protein
MTALGAASAAETNVVKFWKAMDNRGSMNILAPLD